MSKIKYFVFGLSLILFSGAALSQTVNGGDEKKKSLVTSTPINTNTGREYVDVEQMRSPRPEPRDEGTNDPTVSGMTLIYIDGKPVYTKTNTVNGTTITISYTPKEN